MSLSLTYRLKAIFGSRISIQHFPCLGSILMNDTSNLIFFVTKVGLK